MTTITYHNRATPAKKTTRYFKGFQPRACVYEGAETYGEDMLDDDLDQLADSQNDEPDFDNEDYWQASIMARHNLTTYDQYERWLDDAVEIYGEERHQRLLLAAEQDEAA